MFKNMDFEFGNIVPYQDHQILTPTFHEHYDVSTKIEQHPNLQLKFFGNIKNPVYTGFPIEGNGGPLELALVNVESGEIVKYISAQVEVVVLGEELSFGDDQEWSSQDFCNKVANGKNGKSLLRGRDPVVLSLKDGVCLVEGVCFKHGNNWFKKFKCRLGARIVGDLSGIRIMEAKTEPFSVKDVRQMSKDHKTLLWTAKIWEIKGIGKKSKLAYRLVENYIITVKDFLVEYNLHHDRLKQMFEPQNLHRLEIMLAHALSCQIDKNMYLYSSPDELEQTSVVFNSVGKLMGMIYKEDQYVSVEEISETDKVCGQRLIALAFQCWDDVKLYIPRNKRQQAEDSSKSSSSVDQSDGSCSSAVKRQRTSESTPRDPDADWAITDENFGVADINDMQMDSLAKDIASPYYVPAMSDILYNQPLYSPSQYENFICDASFIDGQVPSGDESFIFYQSSYKGCEPRSTGVDVLLTRAAGVPRGQAHTRWKMLFMVFKFISRRFKTLAETQRSGEAHLAVLVQERHIPTPLTSV